MSAVLSVLLAKSQPLLSLEICTLFSKCLLSSQCFLLEVSHYYPWKLGLYFQNFFCPLRLHAKSQPHTILGTYSPVLSSLLAKSQPLLSLEVCTLFSKCLLSSQCFLLEVSACYPWKLALYSQNFSCPHSASC